MPKRPSEAERRRFREAGYCGPLRVMGAAEAISPAARALATGG